MTYLTPPKTVFLSSPVFDNELGNYKTLNVPASGDGYFNFKIPSKANLITSLKLLGNISAGAAQTARNIDFYFEYHAEGEPYNQHSDSDTTSTYDLSAFSGKTYGFELKDKMSSLNANDLVGIFIDHSSIGGDINYFGIELTYHSIS
ncbi:MAG: hypothetical protein FK731_06325 [Asgard group archaeon]|nr:hypothetical protein [Asgard group archaeon]